MTWSAAGFGERQSQSWTFGRSRTGDKHLLSVLGRERNKGKQKEAVGSKVFLFFFFFYVWVNLQDFQPGAKRKHEQLFLTGVRFPATLFLTLLSSIVWHWLGPEKKQKTKNITKHTQKTQPFASGRLGSPVAARSRRAGPISSRATSSALKGVRCVRGGFVPRKKKTLFEERLVKISEGTGPFFPSLSPSACLVGGEFETPCRRGGWRSFISRSYHA